MKINEFCLFKAANADYQIFSLAEWIAVLQANQADLQTALMQICPADDGGQGFVLILVHGQIVNLYQINGLLAQRLPVADLYNHLPGSSSIFKARTLSLTPHTTRLVKILLEQPNNHIPDKVESAKLEQVIAMEGKRPETGLFHVTWPGADGLVLLPGGGKPSQHTLFIASDQVLHSAGGMTALFGWKEPECQVQYYSSNLPSQAWNEYFLYHAFAGQVAHLLQRFEELTGRMLVNSIVREMNFMSSANGWNIVVSARNITDQAVFLSPEQAGQVYQRLFEIINTQAAQVLGQDLMDMLMRESLVRLSAPYRTVVERFVLPRQIEKPV